jgi:hypothetical protein
VAGVPMPDADYAPVDDALPIARWIASVQRAGGTALLWTHASPGIRVCQTALEAGLDISGAQLSIGGEPTTAARLAAIRSAGATAVPHYAAMECGAVGYGCLAPTAPDDLHLFDDLHALVRAPVPTSEGTVTSGTMLISSLRPATRFVLLNASLGDRAELGERACGCPLERFGWRTHLHTIRGLAKLTAGGMTFLDVDVIRVLEQELPARFGGGPIDYQLVEDEADDGQPRVRLLVRPSIGPVDQTALRETFLALIGGGSGAERVMELQWRQAGWPTVERRPPLSSEGGKIVHLWRTPGSGLTAGVGGPARAQEGPP